MSKSKNSMKRYSISLTDKNLENIATLQSELGFASLSETVRACINSMYSDTFPKYIRSAPSSGRTYEQPKSEEELEEEQKEKAKTNAKKKRMLTVQKQADKLALCTQICEGDLNGLVAEDDDGQPVKCAYFQYDGRRRYEQEIDILSVSQDLVTTQYLPNKDYVLKLQKDGHIDYDPKQSIEEVMEAE